MTQRTPRWLALVAVALTAVLAATLAGVAEAGGKKHRKYDRWGKSLVLVGKKTVLNTDPATTKVLLDNGIVPEPVGPTGFKLRERKGMPTVRYTFPITGGMLDKRTLFGTIDHSGGLNFVNQNNGKSLLLTNFRIEIGKDPGLTAMVNNDPNARVRILDLSLERAKVIKQRGWHKWHRYKWRGWHKRYGWRGYRYFRIKNVDATLTEAAAGALNASLGVDFFAAGIDLGTAQVFAKAKVKR